MRTLTLTRIHSPFNRTDHDCEVWEYRGESVADLVDGLLPAEIDFAVSINGRLVPEVEWRLTTPLPGDMVVFVPLVSGGSDGKMIGRMVALIALSAAAMALTGPGGFLATGSLFANGLIAGSLMVVGGILINTILPVQPKAPAQSGLNMDGSQLYSWAPQTIQEQGGAIPYVFGKFKIYGNVIAGSIDHIDDKAYLNALIGLGHGPFAALGDFHINDQPIENFSSVSIDVRLGHINQDVIESFNDTKVEQNVSIKATHATPAQYSTLAPGYDALEVDVFFPSGLFWMNEQTGATIGAGVIIKVEVAEFGTNIWSNLTLSYGNPVQATLNGRYAVDTVIQNNGSIAYRILAGPIADPPPIPSLENMVAKPASTDGTPTQWGGVWKTFSNETVTVVSDVRTERTIQGKDGSRKPVRASFRINNLDVTKRHTIKLTRVTTDVRWNVEYTESYLSAVRAVYLDDFEYPCMALVGIRALATDQLSGSLRFSCIAYGKIVEIWDGAAWSFGPSTNPAWIVYYLLTRPVLRELKTKTVVKIVDTGFYAREGAAEEIAGYEVIRYDGMNPDRIDLAAFIEWADWCNVACPDGKGGTEPRFSFHGGFDANQTLWDAVLTVCQMAGAAPVRRGNKVSLSIDKPAEPVQLFTIGNIGIDSFKETFLPLEDRAAEIEIDFVNADNNYNRDKITVINPNISTVANKVSLQLAGCTSPGQAHRAAMRRLKNNELITRTLEITADIDSITCQTGDVVMIQHDVPQWGFGGRLVSATATTVELDTPVTIEAGKSYAIMVRLSDDTLCERAVSTAAGTTAALTVSTPFPAVPAQYDVYSFGEVNKVAKPFRVADISRQGDISARLGMFEYVESVYALDSETPVISPVNSSALPLTFPSVAALTAYSQLVKLPGGSIGSTVEVTWDASGVDATLFPAVEILYAVSGGQYISAGESRAGQLAFPAPEPGDYTIIARTVNSAGLKQAAGSAPAIALTLTGKITPPGNVAGFSSIFAGNTIALTWSANNDADLAAYEIRTGASWAAGVLLQTTSSASFRYRPAASGSVTYWIAARDTSGNYSSAPATATVAVPAPAVPTAIVPFSQLLEIDLDITFDVARQDTLHVEIWAATTNNRNSASQVGTSKELRWKHRDLANGAVRYYWVRCVTVFGETGGWYPSGATAGVMGSALNNPAKLLQLFNPDITDASVAAYLAESTSLLSLMDTRSMLFELGVVGPGVTATFRDALSQAASQMNANQELLIALNSIVSGLVVTAYNNLTAYTVGQIVEYAGDTYQCILASTGNLPTNATYWAPISGLYDLVNTIQSNLDIATGSFNQTATRLTARLDDLAIINYSGTTDYAPGDYVKWTDLYTYRCLLATGPTLPNTVHDPTNGTYWVLDAKVGRVTAAETSIIQNADKIALTGESITGPLAFVAGAVTEPGVMIESVADVKALEVQVSRVGIHLDTANANIALAASRLDTAEGRLSQAEIDIDGANGAIALKASQTTVDTLTGVVSLKAAQIDLDSANAAILLRATYDDLTGSITVLSDLVGISLAAPGATYTPGMTLAWSDSTHTKSLLRVQTDSFQVGNIVSTVYSAARSYLVDELVTYSGSTYRCILPSTGNAPTNTTYWVPAAGLNYRPVFSVGKINAVDAVGINGDLFVDGSVLARHIAANSLYIGTDPQGNPGKIIMGTGSILSWTQVASRPTDLAGLDSTASTKLGTIATNATVGATWGTNLAGIPANIATAAASPAISVLNNAISIASNGTLAGGGGGQVTITGLGYTGALDANKTTNTNQLTDGANLGGTATWTGVGSKPANLSSLAGTEAILNSGITIDVSGALQGIGSGANTVIKNQMITVSADGKLVGVGTADIVVDNSKVTLASLSAMPLTPATPTNIGSNWIYTGTLTAAQINAVAIDAGSITAGTLTGRTLQTAATGKRFVVDSATNEARFYDTDGTTMLASIGINSSGSMDWPDSIIGLFGTSSTLYTAIAASSNSANGTIRSSGPIPFIADGYGSVMNYGLQVTSTSKRTAGTHRKGFTGSGQLLLSPNWDSGAPTHTAAWGAIWLDADCIMYVQKTDPSGTNWQKVGAQ